MPKNVAASMVLALVAGLVWGLPPAAAVAVGPDGESREPSVPVSPVARSSVPAPVLTPWRRGAAPVWPLAGSAVVDLSSGGSVSTFAVGVAGVEGSVSPGGLPVTVTVPGGPLSEYKEQRLMRGLPVSVAASSVSVLALSSLDQSRAAELGVRGALFTVANGGGQVSGAAPVRLSVGYGAFANAYGGGFGDRLRLVWLPSCALSSPLVAACQTQTPVSGGSNDVVSQSVSGVVDVGTGAAPPAAQAGPADSGPVGSGPVVLAVTAGADSQQGDWKATSLSQAASWQAGSSGGAFSYSVAVPVPPAPGGLTPQIALSYSSGSVDGLTKSTSQQASWIGEGWNYEPGYVERSYRSCFADGEGPARLDLCWVADSPVTVVLDGVSTRLFRNDADGVWRPENDDAGWKVERFTSPGEWFKITTRDGTQYLFGSRWGEASGGVLQVEVFGNNPGEPCFHSGGFAYSHCTMPYRWNLDRVVDVHGNVIDYQWNRFRGNYGGNNNSQVFAYDIYGRLAAIEYGANLNVSGARHTGRVDFSVARRCFYSEAECNADWSKWPDVPWDQHCQLWATSCPGQIAPTFWNIYRLQSINTYVWDLGSGSWQPALVSAMVFDHLFPTTPDEVPPAGGDSSPALWLSHVSVAGMPTMILSGEFRRNRVDWGCCDGNNQQVPAMNRIRLTHIDSGHAGVTTVGYTGEDCAWNSLPAAADENHRRCFPQLDDSVASWTFLYMSSRLSKIL